MNSKIPHDILGISPIHLTYRLAGSLPVEVLNRLKREKEEALLVLENRLNRLLASTRDQHRYEQSAIINHEYNLKIEKAVDEIKTGPFYLQDPRIGQLVLDSWRFLHDTTKVYVYAVCVMGNHVHVILSAQENEPELKLGNLIKSHKTFTARKANQILGRTGLPFWDKTYFDRRIRKGTFITVMWYVINNPLKAKLVQNWEEYHLTWVNPEYIALFMDD